MTIDEVLKVLTKIQLIDSRVVDELVALEWFDLIGHLGFDDTIAAVRVHRQTSTAYLVPAHLIAIVEQTHRDTRRRVYASLEAVRSALPDPVRYQSGPDKFDWNKEAVKVAAETNVPNVFVLALGGVDRDLRAQFGEGLDWQFLVDNLAIGDPFDGSSELHLQEWRDAIVAHLQKAADREAVGASEPLNSKSLAE
jgi:hypothetical protein